MCYGSMRFLCVLNLKHWTIERSYILQWKLYMISSTVSSGPTVWPVLFNSYKHLSSVVDPGYNFLTKLLNLSLKCHIWTGIVKFPFLCEMLVVFSISRLERRAYIAWLWRNSPFENFTAQYLISKSPIVLNVQTHNCCLKFENKPCFHQRKIYCYI